MRISILSLCACVLLLSACESENVWKAGDSPVQFWRPISEPNILMSMDKVQEKLEFDISQCHCGIFPTNTPRNNAIQYQKDQQRLVQTSATLQMNKEAETCLHAPALIVSECMRNRGWEPTTCSGRVPVAGGGSLCGVYVLQ